MRSVCIQIQEIIRISVKLSYFLLYTQHRKFNLDLIWTSQTYDDSDKKIEMTVGYYMIEPTILPGVSRFQEIEPFTMLFNTRSSPAIVGVKLSTF